LPTQKSQPTESDLSARGFRFAIVASRWNDEIVSRLIDGAQAALTKVDANPDEVQLFRIPGAFEIPLCAQKAAESGKFDAVICLGVIIRGDTPHFDYIAASAARGISEVGLRTGVPLLFGIITADNIQQANERSGNDQNNKGYEAAMAAVEVVNLFQKRFEKKD
jgi:6,7-dimethyl-8-ribityllumazine synthase